MEKQQMKGSRVSMLQCMLNLTMDKVRHGDSDHSLGWQH